MGGNFSTAFNLRINAIRDELVTYVRMICHWYSYLNLYIVVQFTVGRGDKIPCSYTNVGYNLFVNARFKNLSPSEIAIILD